MTTPQPVPQMEEPLLENTTDAEPGTTQHPFLKLKLWHTTINVGQPASPETLPPAADERRKCSHSTLFRGIVVTLFLAPTLLLLSTMAGAMIYGPAVVIGHVILLYTLPQPFGDQYSAIPVYSTVITGVVGGAMLGLLGAACIFLVGICVALYQRICGLPKHCCKPRESDAASQRTPSTKVKKFLWYCSSSGPTLFAAGLGARFLQYRGFNHELFLDADHALVAAIVGEAVILTLKGVWLLRKKSQGHVRLEDTPEVADQDVQVVDVKVDVGEKV